MIQFLLSSPKREVFVFPLSPDLGRSLTRLRERGRSKCILCIGCGKEGGKEDRKNKNLYSNIRALDKLFSFLLSSSLFFTCAFCLSLFPACIYTINLWEMDYRDSEPVLHLIQNRIKRIISIFLCALRSSERSNDF